MNSISWHSLAVTFCCFNNCGKTHRIKSYHFEGYDSVALIHSGLCSYHHHLIINILRISSLPWLHKSIWQNQEIMLVYYIPFWAPTCSNMGCLSPLQGNSPSEPEPEALPSPLCPPSGHIPFSSLQDGPLLTRMKYCSPSQLPSILPGPHTYCNKADRVAEDVLKGHRWFQGSSGKNQYLSPYSIPARSREPGEVADTTTSSNGYNNISHLLRAGQHSCFPFQVLRTHGLIWSFQWAVR